MPFEPVFNTDCFTVTTQVLGVKNQSKQMVLKRWGEVPKLSGRPAPLISLANAITKYLLKKDWPLLAKTMTSNGKQFAVTREKLTAVARNQSVQLKVA